MPMSDRDGGIVPDAAELREDRRWAEMCRFMPLPLQTELAVGLRSGFPGDYRVASLGYELSGPVIGASPWDSRDVGVAPAMVEASDLPDLLHWLVRAGGGCDRWAVGQLDDGQFVATGSRGARYVSAGVHLPANLTLIGSACQDDGLFWRVYGARPADRLLGYARHYGWLDRITMLAAVREIHQDDPFSWVRPVVGDAVALVECTGPRPPDGDARPAASMSPRYRWGASSVPGSRHRLAVCDPDRYTLLSTGAWSTTEATLDALAQATVQIAHAALVMPDDPGPGAVGGAATRRRIMEVVAGTDPGDIVQRRLAHLATPGAVSVGEDTAQAVGLPAEAAPAWARHLDRAAHMARRSAMGAAAVREHRCSGDGWMHATSDRDLSAAVHRYAAAELIAVALEAILLWSADPLPVADIAYAAGAARAGWVATPPTGL